jgi:hypothetical protein
VGCSAAGTWRARSCAGDAVASRLSSSKSRARFRRSRAWAWGVLKIYRLHGNQALDCQERCRLLRIGDRRGQTGGKISAGASFAGNRVACVAAGSVTGVLRGRAVNGASWVLGADKPRPSQVSGAQRRPLMPMSGRRAEGGNLRIRTTTYPLPNPCKPTSRDMPDQGQSNETMLVSYLRTKSSDGFCAV